MENVPKKMNKSSLSILIAVGVIVLAVVGYGIWQAIGRENGPSSLTVSTVSGAVELSEENLEGRWVCTGETITHELTFFKEQKLSYQRFETGSETPVLSTTNGTYKIEGNTITLSISAFTGDVSETCQAVFAADTLILTKTNEESSYFAGTYHRAEPEESSSAVESSSSMPESAVSPESNPSVPESATPPESSCTTELSEPEVQNEQWKAVYISYIESLPSDEWDRFNLINLDGDSIPELYVEGSTTAQGNLICTYSNGQIVSENLRGGSTYYLDGGNRLHIHSGSMGLYFDTVYSIQNGDFVQLHSGEFELRDPYGTSYEENDANYRYIWDGKEVTKAEYDQGLYQEAGSGKAAYETMITKSEVITKIANR